ncbi:MAG: tRNA (adenosine(37)-N6)-threonylcarbamoyltransferase complex ATPase subunit type 1 TsaE [Bacteroidota bacterium]
MNSFNCKNIDEIDGIVRNIFNTYPHERVFAFYGKMGSGKTTFIKKMCEQLGVECNTSSPTFAIINDYPKVDRGSVYHFDFYRIKNQMDALDIGFEEYLYSGNYCLIEWSEKIENLLPDNHIRIDIDVTENEQRIISLTKNINT